MNSNRVLAMISLLLSAALYLQIRTSNSITDNLQSYKEKLEALNQSADYQNLENNEINERCDSLKHVNDSLYELIYPLSVELSNYQIAHIIFNNRNPKASKEFYDIITRDSIQ